MKSAFILEVYALMQFQIYYNAVTENIKLLIFEKHGMTQV